MQTLEYQLRKHPLFNLAGDGSDLSVAEAFEKGGLNYEVEATPLFVDTPDGYKEISQRVANRRTDNGSVVGVVSKGYHIVQNERGLPFLNAFLSEGGDDVKVIGAGTINGGAKVFISFQLGDTWTIPGTDGEALAHTITWGTGHDGGTAFDLTFREIRLLCSNGMIMTGINTRYSVKHTSSVDKRISVTAAQNAIGFGYNLGEKFEKEIAALYEQEVTDKRFQEIVASLIEMPKEEGRGMTLAEDKRSLVTQAWKQNSDIKGTALGVYNAFNEIEQWSTGNKTDANAVNDRALVRTLQSNFQLSNRALELVRA